MRKRKQASAAGACSLQSRRGDGRDSVRSTASGTAAVPGFDHGNGLPWVAKAFSQIIAFIFTIVHFLQTWRWAAQPATPQPCKSKDSAAAEPEAAAALVVAQVVTCDIAADTDKLLSSTDKASCNNSNNLQDVETLQQQLQEAQQAAAAARSRAEQLTDELRKSQQCTAEAQQKAVRLEDLYQQAKSAGKKAAKAQQQLATEKDQLLHDLQASRQQQAAADGKAQQLAADLASAEQKWLELQFLCEKATAAAEDALEAHTLLKCREEGMDAELAAANAQLAQLSSQLAAAQQQAAAAAERAAEAEEQCKQADAEAQQACLAKKKLQEEKQQLTKELQQTKAAQAPQQARLQQLYGEVEVARRQLAEGKLHEAIQQGEAAAAAAATAYAQLQTEKQQLTADKQQLRQQLEAAQKSNSCKSAKLTAAEAKLVEAEKRIAELEAAAAAAAAAAASAAAPGAESASKEQEKKQSPAAKAPKKQQQQQQQQQASAAKAQRKQQEAIKQEAVLLKQQLQALQAEHEQLQTELATAKQQLAESVCASSSLAARSRTQQLVVAQPAEPRPSDERAQLMRQLDKARAEQQQHQARLQQLAERLAAAEAELAAAAAAAAAARAGAGAGAEADPQQKLQTCEQELASTQHQVQAGIAKLVQAVQGTITAQQDVADIRSRSHSSEEEGWSEAAEDAALPGLQAAQAALQQQQALVGQVSSELSPALVKIVKLEQQAKESPLQAAGRHHQLQRTAARLAAQLRAAQASQLQQQAKVQQLTQQLEAMEQQQAAAGGAGALQPPATAEGGRQPTAGTDVQDLFLKSAGDFSVHENPTADEEADISAQLRELHFELAEARERIEQIEDARQRAENAALAAYEYQQQLEEHTALLQEELDGCKAQHSQQQARMQQVTDELLRQVTRELAGVCHQLVDSQSKSVKLKVLCKEVFASAHTATGQQHKLSSELANMTQQLEAVESMQQVKLQQLTEELAGVQQQLAQAKTSAAMAVEEQQLLAQGKQQLQQQVQQLNCQLSATSEQLALATQQLAGAQDQLGNMQQQLAAAQQQNTQLAAMCDQVMKTASNSAESQQLAAAAAAMSQQLLSVKAHMLALTSELSWLQDSLAAFEPDVSYKAAVHWLEQQLTPATKLAIAQHLATFDKDYGAGIAAATSARMVSANSSQQQEQQQHATLGKYLAAAMEACLVRIAAVRSVSVVRQLLQLPGSSLFTAYLLQGAARLLVYGQQPGVYKATVSGSSSSISSSEGASVDVNAMLLAAVPYALEAERQHKEGQTKAVIVATVLHWPAGSAGESAIRSDSGSGSSAVPLTWAEALEAVADTDAAVRQTVAAKYSNSISGIYSQSSSSPRTDLVAAKHRPGKEVILSSGYGQQPKTKHSQGPAAAATAAAQEQQLSAAAWQQLLRAVYWLGPDYKLARSLLRSCAESALTEQGLEALRVEAMQQWGSAAPAPAAAAIAQKA